MNYPIQIDNEPQLMRLIAEIAKAVIKEMKPEKPPPLMSKQDAYKIVSRLIVDRAIKNGNLKLHSLEGRIFIKTKDFEDWINRSPLEQNRKKR